MFMGIKYNNDLPPQPCHAYPASSKWVRENPLAARQDRPGVVLPLALDEPGPPAGPEVPRRPLHLRHVPGQARREDAGGEFEDAGPREEEVEPRVWHVPEPRGAELELAGMDTVQELHVRHVLNQRQLPHVAQLTQEQLRNLQ
jgi:hypothetical protein